jgi:hypothetical protein
MTTETLALATAMAIIAICEWIAAAAVGTHMKPYGKRRRRGGGKEERRKDDEDGKGMGMGIKGDAGCLGLGGIMWNNNNGAMATKGKE